MKKMTLRILVAVLLFFSFLLQGCASYKPLVKKDFASLAPLTVVYYADDVRVKSWLRWIAPASVGVGIAEDIHEKSLQKTIASGIRPGFSALVMKKFVDRVCKETTNCPAMAFEEKPVTRSYIRKFKSGNLMIFACQVVLYTGNTYFISGIKARIQDSEGNVLWAKGLKYDSKDYGRKFTFNKYISDDFKLLKEEIDFAADIIVSDFIQSLLK